MRRKGRAPQAGVDAFRPTRERPARVGPPCWIGALGLLVAVGIAYTPAYHAGFIWDDDAYVTENTTLRSLNGLARIWFEPGAVPQYYPLVHTTYWIEHHFWGLNPAGYHIVNVVLHGVVALLLWRLLRRLDLPGAWLIAAVFALHPVHVESVAWVTERKNTLSGIFYLLALLAYLRFRPPNAPPTAQQHRWRWYIATLVCFVAALLSKSVTVTLIPALLVIAWWRHGRITRSDVWPLIPLAVAALVVCPFSMWIEHGLVAGEAYAHEDWQLSPTDRVLVAGRALWFYVGKLLYPTDLAFCYDRWSIDPTTAWQWAFPAGVLLVFAGVVLLRRKIGRGPAAALVLFVVTLSPALGFVNYYPMRYSFVADHFQYLASIAVLTLLVAGACAIRVRTSPPVQRVGLVIAGAVLLTMGVLTWRQCRIYASPETLWRDTLVKRPDCYIALNNLSVELKRQGRFAEMIPHLQHAQQVHPDNREILCNLANAYGLAGRSFEALQLQLAWLHQHPDDAVVHYNLAVTYHAGFNRADQAVEHLQRALALEPDFAPARELLGLIRARGMPTTDTTPAVP